MYNYIVKKTAPKVIISILITSILLLASIGIVSGDEHQEDEKDDDEDDVKDKDDSTINSIKVEKDRTNNAGANGKSTFLSVDDYKHWVVKVNKAKDRNGVDTITVEYDSDTRTLSITAKDTNSTNNVNILINKEFVDDLISDDPDNLNFDLSEAVNFNGMNSSNASNGIGSVYVFHIKHFSTQTIIISPIVFVSTTGYIAIGIGGIVVMAAAVYLFRPAKGRW
jgi:hypothetical protein